MDGYRSIAEDLVHVCGCVPDSWSMWKPVGMLIPTRKPKREMLSQISFQTVSSTSIVEQKRTNMKHSNLSASLAQGRTKRATAGNRMQALMSKEFESEETFLEAENDEEFVARDGAFDGVLKHEST